MCVCVLSVLFSTSNNWIKKKLARARNLVRSLKYFSLNFQHHFNIYKELQKHSLSDKMQSFNKYILTKSLIVNIFLIIKKSLRIELLV